MEQLRELAKKLGNPGADKLFTAARKRGIAVTRNQIKQLLETKGAKQLFRPLPESKGKTGAEAPFTRMMMDLIEFRTAPSKVGRETYRYILVLIDVFSREVWAAPTKDKTPAAIEPVLRRLLAGLPKQPAMISSDKGNEWVGPVQELLDARGIIRKTKDPADANALGVVDRAIQTLKKKLAESLSEEPGEWASRILQVVKAYNSTPHASIHGEPEEVKSNEIQSFLVLQDNATKLKSNQTLLETRKKQLVEKGAFRRPLKGLNAFRRGFKAAYGPVEKVETVSGSLVKPQGDGVTIDVKRVQTVSRQTGDVEPWYGGLSMRDSKKKDALIDVMIALVDFLKDGEERSVARAAAFLKDGLGDSYADTLREQGFGKHLAEAIRLFPETFLLVKAGYYVRLV
jgi:transposase InsO family protein